MTLCVFSCVCADVCVSLSNQILEELAEMGVLSEWDIDDVEEMLLESQSVSD